MDIAPSIRKTLLGNPVVGKSVKGECAGMNEGKGARIKAIRIDPETINAFMMFIRSLIPTYLQVILYILKQVNSISLIRIKSGKVDTNKLKYF
jgi:hypothetical protein